MKKVSRISKLPPAPSIYAVYTSRDPRHRIAYVGAARSLKRRLAQQVAAGPRAPGFEDAPVTRVQWWEHGDFATQHVLVAAKAVAEEVLGPAAGGPGALTEPAKQVYSSDHFHRKMRELFGSEPSGQLILDRGRGS